MSATITPPPAAPVADTSAAAPPPPASTDAGAGGLAGGADDFGWVDKPFAAVENPVTPLPPEAGADPGTGTQKAGAETGEHAAEDATKTAQPGTDKTAAAAGDTIAQAKTAASEVDTDPDLSDEDRALVKDHAETGREGLTSRLKDASFISKFKDPSIKKAETRDELRKRSPSQYAELEAAVVTDVLAKPEQFMQRVWEWEQAGTVPEGTYGKLATDVFANDPTGFFVEAVTGQKNVKPETVKEALDFFNTHREEQTIALPELPEEDVEGLAVDYPDVAKFLDQIKLARKGDLPPAVRTKLDEATNEIARLKAELADKSKPDTDDKSKKPDADKDAQAKVGISDEGLQLFNTGRDGLIDYSKTYASDTKAGLGYSATADERKSAPEVADLKDDAIHYWVNGHPSKNLPDFDTGLAAWGKDNVALKKLVNDAMYFAEKGEQDNMNAAIARIKPIVDQYNKERVKHEVFQTMNRRIKEASTRAGIKPVVETIIPGGGSQTTSKRDDGNDFAFLDDFTPQR